MTNDLGNPKVAKDYDVYFHQGSNYYIGVRKDVNYLGEKCGWYLFPLENEYCDRAFYLGAGTWDYSDAYRCSNLDINGKTAEEYKRWLWNEGVADICNNPKRYKFKTYKQIFSKGGDGFKNLILELVDELANNGKIMLVVDRREDIRAAKVLADCVNYLYDNDYGIEIPF